MIIESTAYFPPIDSFVAISRGEALIEVNETYQKHSYRNRTKIMSAGGTQLLTVPIIGGRGVKSPIKEVEVDYSTNFQRQHIKAIISSYRSAPYWEHFSDRVLKMCEIKEKYLLDLNCRITEELLSLMRIDAKLQFTESFIGVSKGSNEEIANYSTQHPYYQVYGHKYPFEANLSILDWLFCEGYLEL